VMLPSHIWSPVPLVELVINTYSRSGRESRCLGHDLGHGYGGPVAWMGMLIPFLEELVDLCTSMVFGFNIRDPQAFALQDTEPLFDVLHP
jgi:hypothetical protein